MDNVLILIIISLVTESVWETLKMTWQNGKLSVDRVGAIITGLIISFATNTDIFKLIEVNITIPFVGVMLTGILISRGANFVHDLYTKITKSIS